LRDWISKKLVQDATNTIRLLSMGRKQNFRSN